LRELVETGLAQEGAPASPPRVVAAGPDRAGMRLGVDAHGAELQHPERAPVQPTALLAVEDWPRLVNLIKHAIAAISGARMTSATAESSMSIARFTMTFRPK